MNIQEILESYNVYKFRIKMAKIEITELENEIIEIRASNLDGMPKAQGLSNSKVEEMVIAKEQKTSDKRKYIKNLENKIEIVERLVKTLKKYNQDIIEERFYLKKTIEEIAVKNNKTYSAITKTLEQSIKKIQQEYNKNKKV